LPQAKSVEPVRNLLHGGPPLSLCGLSEPWRLRRLYHFLFRFCVSVAIPSFFGELRQLFGGGSQLAELAASCPGVVEVRDNQSPT
jgi:hypothetical protein